MTLLRSIGLFAMAAVAEIGGACLPHLAGSKGKASSHRGGSRSGRPRSLRFFSTFQPSPHFGRILAAYGGVFVVGSLTWGVVFDGVRPDRWDLIGAGICLIGVSVIMYVPRPR